MSNFIEIETFSRMQATWRLKEKRLQQNQKKAKYFRLKLSLLHGFSHNKKLIYLIPWYNQYFFFYFFFQSSGQYFVDSIIYEPFSMAIFCIYSIVDNPFTKEKNKRIMFLKITMSTL